jgi:hypothetical protein
MIINHQKNFGIQQVDACDKFEVAGGSLWPPTGTEANHQCSLLPPRTISGDKEERRIRRRQLATLQ